MVSRPFVLKPSVDEPFDSYFSDVLKLRETYRLDWEKIKRFINCLPCGWMIFEG